MAYEPKYHDQAAVEQLFRQAKVTFTETSPVTQADLADHIEKTEEYVESRIRSKYQVPVTDSEAVKILGEICAMLTAAKVWRILNQLSQAGGANLGKDWETSAERKLDLIVAGKMTLGGLTVEGAGSGPRTGIDTSEDPTWKLGTDQW